MAGSKRGIQRERAVRKLLEGAGWWVCRAAGSLGDADLVALRAEPDTRLEALGIDAHPPTTSLRLMVEVKSTAAGPFHSFGPADRNALIAAAEMAGAEAWLAYWPPRGALRWIPASAWPSSRIGVVAAAA